MNTPTPRTDAAWNATFDTEQTSAGKTARTLREHSQQLETELVALIAERDQLRAEVERLNALGSWAHTCTHHNDEQRAKAKGCPVCATTERDAANARAERAEAELAAEREKSERYRLATLRLDAELAAERARLDWLESNAGDIPKYNSRSFIWFANQNLRAAIDAAMKEGAK